MLDAVKSPTGSTADKPPAIKATGGKVERRGGYVYHTFCTNDMFCAVAPIPLADVLLVAGGGGGGGAPMGLFGHGGEVLTVKIPNIDADESFEIAVGIGGKGGAPNSDGCNGQNTTAFSLTASGGSGGVPDSKAPLIVSPSFAGSNLPLFSGERYGADGMIGIGGDAENNTGNGGNGGNKNPLSHSAGRGGDGIVIIRYKA